MTTTDNDPQNIGDHELDEARRTYERERAKRLREEGNDQFQTATGDFSDFQRDYYAPEHPDRAPLTDCVDVAIIGGGMAGLLAGAQMREAGFERIRIVEKGSDFGGTWYWNRYPGAQCDVESHIYLPLLEELGYVPSEKYAHQPEIFAHLKSVGRHFDLYTDACFQTEAKEMQWDDAASEWIVETNRGDEFRAQFLIIASGDQHTPRLPAIPGIGDFAGTTFHTSRWNRDFARDDLSGFAGKRVGVVGTGATALQVVPAIAHAVSDLFVFQRTPSSVSVRGNCPTPSDFAESLYPGWQRERMNNFTAFVTGVDMSEDLVGDGWTHITKRLNEAGKGAADTYAASESADLEIMEQVRARVDTVVEDPSVAASLKPYYRFNCKRPGFHDEYLAAFNRENVTLVDTHGRGIERIEPAGAVVDETLYELDCLIFATGFDVGSGFAHSHGFDIVGREGIKLSDKWSEGLRTFHGMHTHGFPNCFFLGVTQTGVSINFAHSLTEQTAHLGWLLARLRANSVQVVETTEEAENSWVEHIRDGLTPAMLRFLRECTPGYFNNEGQPNDPRRLQAGRYPEGPMKFFAVLDQWRRDGRLAGLQLSYPETTSDDTSGGGTDVLVADKSWK